MLTCSKVPRFQPQLERRGTDCQCWHTFPPCGKWQAVLQHLPRGRTQWRRIQPRGRWQLRPSTVTCRFAMGLVSDHQVSSRLCGTTLMALLSFVTCSADNNVRKSVTSKVCGEWSLRWWHPFKKFLNMSVAYSKVLFRIHSCTKFTVGCVINAQGLSLGRHLWKF